MSEAGYGNLNQNSILQTISAESPEALVAILARPRTPLQVLSINFDPERGYVAFFRSHTKLVRTTGISRGGEAGPDSV